MTRCEIKDSTTILQGKIHRYYIFVSGDSNGYLYPDLQIFNECRQTDFYHGWYETKQDAQLAVDVYQGRETNMRQKITDSMLVIAVENVLTMWIQQSKMFTAYDVTCQIRKDAPGDDIHHDRVRTIIETKYLTGRFTAEGYRREVGQVSANGDEAYIYHYEEDNPDNYFQPVSVPTPIVTTPTGLVIRATFDKLILQ